MLEVNNPSTLAADVTLMLENTSSITMTAFDSAGQESAPSSPYPVTLDSTPPAAADSDKDGITDSLDNCPLTANPGQADSDLDGVGDVCDNCPQVKNADQRNSDNDTALNGGMGFGDACDTFPLDSAKWLLSQNGLPQVPTVNFPVDGYELTAVDDVGDPQQPIPTLSVQNVSDPDALKDPAVQQISYEFALFEDAQRQRKTDGGTVEENGTANATEWRPAIALAENTTYFWQARACDGVGCSVWSPLASFFVNMANDPPILPQDFAAAPSSSQVAGLSVELETYAAFDPDDMAVRYEFELYRQDAANNLVLTARHANGMSTVWNPGLILQDNTTYSWRVRAVDDGGAASGWSDYADFLVNTANQAPTMPTVATPIDGKEVAALPLAFMVYPANDGDGDPLSYLFELCRVEADNSCVSLESAEVAGGSPTISWAPAWFAGVLPGSADDNSWYIWRVTASDGLTASGWRQEKFFLNLVNDPPEPPLAKDPKNGATVGSLALRLEVLPAVDPDLDPIIDYRFLLYGGNDLLVPLADSDKSGTVNGTVWEDPSISLDHDSLYYWRAIATDGHGASSDANGPLFSFSTGGNFTSPTAPLVHNPPRSSGSGASTVDTLQPTLSVFNSTDADGDQLTYRFELYKDIALTNDGVFPVVSEPVELIKIAGTTAWHIPVSLEEGWIYYWRVGVSDGLHLVWMPTASFTVDATGTINSVKVKLEAAGFIDASPQMNADVPVLVEVQDQESPIYGAGVYVKPAALPESAIIQIGEASNTRSFPDRVVHVGNIVQFSSLSEAGEDLCPAGSDCFRQPVTIKIPYTDEELQAKHIDAAELLEIFTFDELQNEWTYVPNSEVDKVNKMVIAEVTHFSLYALGVGTGSAGGVLDGRALGVTTSTDGGGGGCFIATAAFGSILEPQVKTLRLFRDRFLLTNPIGRAFVRLYYSLSPPIADFIADRDWLRAAVRVMLLPFIAVSWLAVNAGPSVMLFGVFATALCTCGLFVFKHRRQKGIRQDYA